MWNENFPWWSKFSPTLTGVFPIMCRVFFSSVDVVFSPVGGSLVLSFLRIFSGTSFQDPCVISTISRVGSHSRWDLSLSLSFFFLLKSRALSRKFSKSFWIDLKYNLRFSIWSQKFLGSLIFQSQEKKLLSKSNKNVAVSQKYLQY